MSKVCFWEKLRGLFGNGKKRAGRGGNKGDGESTTGKYRVGDCVWFFHRGDRTTGNIYKVYGDEDGNPVYDVQVGGQCPSFRYGMKETELYLKK